LWLAVVFHRILGSGSDGVMRCTEKYVLDFWCCVHDAIEYPATVISL
jgi:hypothetical protein